MKRKQGRCFTIFTQRICLFIFIRIPDLVIMAELTGARAAQLCCP